MNCVVHSDAIEFVRSLDDSSVDLFLFDPPYYGIVKEAWDKQWPSSASYMHWFLGFISECIPKMKPNASLMYFGGVGSHGQHTFWKSIISIEETCSSLTYRNTITWKKRRAFGKSHDYLFCREEIVWFSRSANRTGVTFNIPYTDRLRGYDGFNKKYPAKSPYKRVSNVWDDIPELMRPSRTAQKPVALMERLVVTHSNVGDLVVDPFAGSGATGVAALANGRRFMGSDEDAAAVVLANESCENVRRTQT